MPPGCFPSSGKDIHDKNINQNEDDQDDQAQPQPDPTNGSTSNPGRISPHRFVKLFKNVNKSLAFEESKHKKKVAWDESSLSRSKVREFRFSELMDATDGNLDTREPGKVYIGQLSTGEKVAIKQLYACKNEEMNGFYDELSTVGNADHPNLVKLIGYCKEGLLELLVYEYMPLGSLSNRFYGRGLVNEVIDWKTRMKIAAGAARGLEYLHDKMKPGIVHGRLKSSNILLGENFHPKLSNFGFATLGPIGDASGAINTAPPSAITGQLEFSSDIYKFGVILLEIITGKALAGDDRARGEKNLLSWAGIFLKEKKIKFGMADPLLRGRYPEQSLEDAISIAEMCLREKPDERESIAVIVSCLDAICQRIDDSPNKEQANQEGSSSCVGLSENDDEQKSIGSDDQELTSKKFMNAAQTFKFSELEIATEGFRRDNFLGEGRFGKVYLGRLGSTGQMVAIKQLDSNSCRGAKEFIDEVLTLCKANHQNLVKLIGYCAEGEEKLLVWDYMPLGSLKDHLHGLCADGTPLNWNMRMKIAAGAAHGLEYLHKMAPSVIHCDLKSSNVLLVEEFHAKLSDFNLARLGHAGNGTYVSTRVKGTNGGYCAPEYALTGMLTLSSDVYSFGVLLLEIITGRKAIDNRRPIAERRLVDWAWPLLTCRRDFKQMADPALGGQYPEKGLCQALALAALCIQGQPDLRPSISDVFTALNKLAHPPKEY